MYTRSLPVKWNECVAFLRAQARACMCALETENDQGSTDYSFIYSNGFVCHVVYTHTHRHQANYLFFCWKNIRWSQCDISSTLKGEKESGSWLDSCENFLWMNFMRIFLFHFMNLN